jgi:DNA-binding NtrC family response regulator
VNILILGESGTGKELVARAIFYHSGRSSGPFLAVNAAAIPDTLLESELFGHERGSFTGADRKRLGKFEQANHGTLFLDEIGDMSVATQAKVLRALQDGRFERVGGNETIQTDVRIIAATNQNLEELIEQGRFRQDLYYRLKVFTIELPPLRDRLEDLPELLDHFIKLYNRELGKQIQLVSAGAVTMLSEHAWPGNVRELQSAVKYALVHARGNVLTPECFPESCISTAGRVSTATVSAQNRDSDGPSPPMTADPGHRKGAPGLDIGQRFEELLAQGHADTYHTIENEVDRFLLTEALRRAHGNQVEASRLLGISRTTLRAKLESLSLSIEKQVQTNASHNDQTLNT